MPSNRLALRCAALIGAGALALHQLRYLVGYSSSAEDQLAAQGHGYLSLVGPLLVLVLALAAGQFLASLARGGAAGAERAPASLKRLWLGTSALLVGIYAAQEWLEGLLSPGHPAGLAGIVGDGGWWAVLIALSLGALIALGLRGSEVAGVLVPAGGRPSSVRRPQSVKLPARVDAFPVDVIARNLAGRAPPPTSR